MAQVGVGGSKCRFTGIKRAWKKYKVLYCMIGVIMLYYFVFSYVPIITGTIISFKNLKVGGTISKAAWVGLENYKVIFRDPEMLGIIKNTLQISVLRMFWNFWPPIILAIAIFEMGTMWYKKFSQTIVYIPYFFSWVIVYGIVYAFFSGNGLVNATIRAFGGSSYEFIANVKTFRTMLIGSQVWKGIGWGTILYFAALTGVNPELYEAAKIDGAGPLRRIGAVTLPALMPIVVFQLIMTLGNILNNDFEQILMYYNAAVYDVADIIDTWVYRIGIGKMQYGIGQAVTIMKAVISFVLIVGTNRLSKKLSGRGMW